MFKKQYRLHASEFKEVFNFGKTIKSPITLIKVRENNLNHSRFAVVVSKKIAKKAVERNYIRRKFTHALKEVYTILQKNDYIFILNSGVKDIQYKDLISELNNLKIK